MTKRRRSANFIAHLVIIDEPQLFLLQAQKSYILALAIPDSVIDGFEYVAVSVTSKNWQRYLDGFVDVRYLFTYPFHRTLYKFSSSDWDDSKVLLTPHDDAIPERALPSSGLFSRAHTEPFYDAAKPTGHEKLLIDGEWELDDFGRFYRKYSDIYYVAATLSSYNDHNQPQALKGRTKSTFTSKPYKGGTSYMHMFDELHSCIQREHRLGLEGITYNSPGDVRILGDAPNLAAVEKLVCSYLANRKVITDNHRNLRKYLADSGYLKMSAKDFSEDDIHKEKLSKLTYTLSCSMEFPYYDVLKVVCGENSLVISKVMLAIYRRVESAATFFAEGRISFE